MIVLRKKELNITMNQEPPIDGISDCCTAPTEIMSNVRNKGHKILICTECKSKLWEHKPEREKISTITVFDIIKERITSLI